MIATVSCNMHGYYNIFKEDLDMIFYFVTGVRLNFSNFICESCHVHMIFAIKCRNSKSIHKDEHEIPLEIAVYMCFSKCMHEVDELNKKQDQYAAFLKILHCF